MKAFLLAVVGAFAIAAISFGVMSQVQEDSWRAFTTESVRVGDPNLDPLHKGGTPQPAQAASASE